MTPANLFFGWKPHTAQSRKLICRATPAAGIFDNVTPGKSSDLTWQTKVLDQGPLGSCTAQAVAQGIWNAQARTGGMQLLPSRLFLYYLARARAGEQSIDAGSQVSTVFDVAADAGVPAENFWGYDVAQFAEMPDTMAFQKAYDAQGVIGVDYIEFGDVADPVDLIRRANSAGYTVQFGSDVTTDYADQEPTEIIHLNPKAAVVGGHAQTVCGYDDDREYVLVMGSWGDYSDPVCPPGVTRWGYDFVRAKFSDLCVALKAPRMVLP
jgi:hypothetical protein